MKKTTVRAMATLGLIVGLASVSSAEPVDSRLTPDDIESFFLAEFPVFYDPSFASLAEFPVFYDPSFD